MFQFMYSVSLNGVFIFKTDWMYSPEARKAASYLIGAFPVQVGFVVEENRKDATITSRQVN